MSRGCPGAERPVSEGPRKVVRTVAPADGRAERDRRRGAVRLLRRDADQELARGEVRDPPPGLVRRSLAEVVHGHGRVQEAVRDGMEGEVLCGPSEAVAAPRDGNGSG